MSPGPSHPQPSVDFLAFIEAPFWLTDLLLTPVLIEVFLEPVSRFVEVFTGRVTFEDLRHSVGDKWIPDGRFYVADSTEGLRFDDVLHLQPGTLIRLMPPILLCPRCAQFGEKLQSPRRWFRWFRPAESSPPDDNTDCGGAGLVGQWGDWSHIPTFPGVGRLPVWITPVLAPTRLAVIVSQEGLAVGPHLAAFACTPVDFSRGS